MGRVAYFRYSAKTNLKLFKIDSNYYLSLVVESL